MNWIWQMCAYALALYGIAVFSMIVAYPVSRPFAAIRRMLPYRIQYAAEPNLVLLATMFSMLIGVQVYIWLTRHWLGVQPTLAMLTVALIAHLVNDWENVLRTSDHASLDELIAQQLGMEMQSQQELRIALAQLQGDALAISVAAVIHFLHGMPLV